MLSKLDTVSKAVVQKTGRNMGNVLETIESFLLRHNLQDKTIIVGFSGGYDSMCLLDVLSKLKNKQAFFDMNVIAAHFNHNWRGEESLKEQEVCRIFATAKGFEFYTKFAPNGLKKTENDARIARYDFFEEAFEEFDADAVFTAHNNDDNAETLLYRIIKGTGIVGLKGISEKRNFFYRPMLSITRKDIVQYCVENNLAPNNDSSNADIHYKRNFLRLNVLPMLEKINENVKDALNTLAKNAINDNQIIEEYLSSIRYKVLGDCCINPVEYKELSKPVKLRFLYEFIQELGLDYDNKKITDIYDFIENNINQRNASTLSLASALWLYVDEKTIETIPKRRNSEEFEALVEMQVSGEGEYEFCGHKLIIRPFEEDKIFIFPESTANFAYVDMKNIKYPLILRTRRDGDVISPFGMSGSMKLKKYMNAKGVPRHKRNDMMLLASDAEILWVIGVGLSNKIGVKEKPTHVIEWF